MCESLSRLCSLQFQFLASDSSLAIGIAKASPGAVGRSALFLVIMACVHLAGYLLYVEQLSPVHADAISPRASFDYSPQYGPALKRAVLLQLVAGVLTALMLDGGRSLGFFKVAIIGHWIGILLITGRRPHSPTKVDIILIRWGALLLLLVAAGIAPFIWLMIGESHLSGWERLSN
jgi:hypothetical protein